LWFPPDDRWPQAAEINGQRIYRKGEAIVKLQGRAGDHLLVDRLTYNFRRPKRGEVIVFKTRGIKGLPQDVLYIKRLVGLPGEKIQIGNDQHLIIDGERLTASNQHFENVYTIVNPGESRYSGHVNEHVARSEFHMSAEYSIAPLFPDEKAAYQVPADQYVVMGDNSLNSLDSRAWGSFSQRSVMGRCWFIYWPFTQRFGWRTW
jgi:signal peptidase I